MGGVNQDKEKKVLVIRFSAIGDVVLTSPIIRALKSAGFQVDYVVKEKFKNAIENNQNIDKLFTLEQDDLKEELLTQKYSLVIDLQNNLKSLRLRKGLSQNIRVVNKENIKKLLLVRTGIDLLHNQHIVERYFKALGDLGVEDDGKGLDFHIPDDFNIDHKSIPLDLSKPYITWVIGASYPKKVLPMEHIIKTCNEVKLPIAILGGPGDKLNGQRLIEAVNHQNIHNFCGRLSLIESAFIVKKSCLVLSNDTGLMHIASASRKRIISFWGCTKPSLGMFPFRPKEGSIELLSKSHKAPCSKLGNRCKSDNKGCIKNIDPKIILEAVERLLKMR
jgi:ADP-heptose:LPS heptosyltransferase